MRCKGLVAHPPALLFGISTLAPPTLPRCTLTGADFQLLYLLNYSEEIIPGVLAQTPKLAALRTALNADPRMQKHFANHAQPLVTPEYISQVKMAQLPKA